MLNGLLAALGFTRSPEDNKLPVLIPIAVEVDVEASRPILLSARREARRTSQPRSVCTSLTELCEL